VSNMMHSTLCASGCWIKSLSSI